MIRGFHSNFSPLVKFFTAFNHQRCVRSFSKYTPVVRVVGAQYTKSSIGAQIPENRTLLNVPSVFMADYGGPFLPNCVVQLESHTVTPEQLHESLNNLLKDGNKQLPSTVMLKADVPSVTGVLAEIKFYSISEPSEYGLKLQTIGRAYISSISDESADNVNIYVEKSMNEMAQSGEITFAHLPELRTVKALMKCFKDIAIYRGCGALEGQDSPNFTEINSNSSNSSEVTGTLRKLSFQEYEKGRQMIALYNEIETAFHENDLGKAMECANAATMVYCVNETYSVTGILEAENQQERLELIVKAMQKQFVSVNSLHILSSAAKEHFFGFLKNSSLFEYGNVLTMSSIKEFSGKFPNLIEPLSFKSMYSKRKSLYPAALLNVEREIILREFKNESLVIKMNMKKLMDEQEAVVLKPNKPIHSRDSSSANNTNASSCCGHDGKDTPSNNKTSTYQRYIDQLTAIRSFLPKDTEREISRMLQKFKTLSMQDQDYALIDNYLKEVSRIPWNQYSTETIELESVATKLNEDHYGFDSVKKHILGLAASSLLRRQKNQAVAATGSTSLDGDNTTTTNNNKNNDNNHNNNTKVISDDNFGRVSSSKILCLLGPPGTGKTSFAKSIAKSLGRNFERISLSGLHGSAVFKGSNYVYTGARCGYIATALQRAKTMNPVILLDEIDKTGSKIMSSLLEVLDPTQNSKYEDLYLAASIDISQVLFVCTANDVSELPKPLLNRMHVVPIRGYTMKEKLNIAQTHLIPASMKACGIYSDNTDDNNNNSSNVNANLQPNIKVHIPEATLKDMINLYCREAGVRSLRRHIDKVFNWVVLRSMRSTHNDNDNNNNNNNNDDDDDSSNSNDKQSNKAVAEQSREVRLEPTIIRSSDLEKILSYPQYYSPITTGTSPVCGSVFGLAFDGMGGRRLLIECVSLGDRSTDEKDQPRLLVTGNLREVMSESIEVAFSYARSFLLHQHSCKTDLFQTKDFHVHINDATTPKDGPSAGIAIVTALLSQVLGYHIPSSVCMTGEVTLTGKVARVGGIQEKMMAAVREESTEVILPISCREDWNDLSTDITDVLTPHFVATYSEVFDIVFKSETEI